MTTQPSDSQDPLPIAQPAPPTVRPPYIPPPRQTSWPVVLGILAIILGTVGVLGLIWQAVAAMIPSISAAAASQPSPVPKALVPIMGLFNAVLSVMLLAGGISLIRRRRFGARLLKVWAGVDVVFTVAASVVSAAGMSGMLAQMQQQNPAAASVPPGMMAGFVIGGACVGLVMGLGPPVFTLIWFGRRKIKDEVSTWA